MTLRSDRPVNIVTAFEMPVKTNGGYIENSVKQLEKGLKDAQTFVATPLSTLSIGLKENNQSDFNALLEQLGKVLEENL